MSQTTQPAGLPVITWSGQRVITTELLAKQYGTEPNNIKVNHSRNRDRFVEGKHFYRVAGQPLRILRLTLSNSQISTKTRSLILWTKRGAARHAKMLETDPAWDVFEALEDAYFDREENQATEPKRLSTVLDREPILVDSVLIMTRHRISLPHVYRGLSHYVGVNRFRSMSRNDVISAHQFAERILTGQDTDSDWRQFQSNRAALTGQQAQLELNPFETLVLMDSTAQTK